MLGEINLRLSGRVRESTVDGPGLRYAVFTQGCPHACPGCHNPHSWPLEGGEQISVAELLLDIRRDKLLRGVTLTGGEPFLQAGPLAVLAQAARTCGLDVWAYTGYTWEQLRRAGDPDWPALLLQTDVLVDGRYERERREYRLRFRGSANQRLIDVGKSLDAGHVVLWE